MMSLLLLMIILAVPAVQAKAHHWTPDTYPNPRTRYSECGRNTTSWVCDPDGLMPVGSANDIDAIIARIAVGGKPYAQAPCGTSGLEGFRASIARFARKW
jgi:hypothetical protein